MKSLAKHATREDQTNEGATSQYFRQLFTQDMDNLYLLSLVLTGDHQKAQRCLIAGLEDSSSNKVFKEWAHLWAKRAIIQNAISALRPRPERASSSATVDDFHADQKQASIGNLRREVANVLELPEFDRFVFVMSVLEGYSEDSCALLLGCSVQDICRARAKAYEQIAALAQADSANDSGRDLQEVNT